MALSGWPGDTQVDDSGPGQDGTVWNRAWSDAAKAAIEDWVVSATNPTVKCKHAIDELVTARGSAASLAARLAVALAADGTPLPAAGQATEAQIAAQAGGSWIQNGDCLIWPAGDAAAPSGFTLAGAGAAIARTGTGLADTNTKVGPFSMKVTRAAADVTVTQALLNSTSFAASGQHLKGGLFVYGVWVLCSTANVARVRMYDGVTSTTTDYHTGDGTWQFLAAHHPVSGSATELSLILEVKNSSGDAYFSGVSALPGLVALTGWVPCPKLYGTLFFPLGSTITATAAKQQFLFARPTLVREVQLRVVTAPTDAALIVDVNHWDGAAFQSMFSTRPQIAASALGGSAKPDGTYRYRCFAGANGTTIADALLNFDVDQVGSTIPGSDLQVMVRALQYARPQENLLDSADGF